MEFVKEFAIFLFKNNIIKFGNFTLSSGKKSSYYIDLRLVPSFPHQFRKMIKNLQKLIIEKIGLDNFDSLVSIPTGGLIIGSALAIETVKPLIYVRNKPKDHGTTKSLEGKILSGMQVMMIDDVATTGTSILNGIKELKAEGLSISNACVIINRLEGADKILNSVGVILHQLTDILEITEILFQEKLVSEDILEEIKKQVSQNHS
ncbi:MAG: orotate phosphoribosyltransferase [Candidatus Nitrosopelagicus sp.]|jgi:orotate phosphoribosyltransferase|nr:orotate phosphoribosyltransferase [Candidatus Nitrosopelagicus sp.]PXF24134.1 MAG: orotate phosphoribosyltransferase [Nitrososphaerota archaeon]HIA96998.1 orotate phosphoribosyltransferase [Candidatus Nitrosopelagicus sp.]HIC05692.1 orotate phosphoribosyltransferase [Candidatus Nitrosopelagicus sp.]|tara:strand:- start:4083 stop:4697 length:615 start_codon:yes stop_codon:yes gene_type:complete